jgi:ABC-type transport system involved in cytochrome bd biosynthesis fused ATPase/permease subunit
MSLSQFHGRDFVDGGSTTSGDAVLRGLRIAPGAPLYPMFLGHLGFIAVVLALALLLLSTWTPGGVRHARRVPADAKGKELARADRAHALQLAYVRRHLPRLNTSETPVLTRVSAVFPPGAVTVVMGPSGSGKSTLLRLLAGRPLAGGALGAFVPAGAVTLNGAPLSARNRHACALVEQEGMLRPSPRAPPPAHRC